METPLFQCASMVILRGMNIMETGMYGCSATLTANEKVV